MTQRELDAVAEVLRIARQIRRLRQETRLLEASLVRATKRLEDASAAAAAVECPAVARVS